MKRRKPVVISEPPKYEYPTYDSTINNNNINNANKNDDSSHSTNASVNNSNPMNLSAVLSVVTGIKLPDVQYDPNASANKSQVADKPKISHGKPNFIINQKENVQLAQPVNQRTSPKSPIKNTSEVAPVKLQRPNYFNSMSTDKTQKINETKPLTSAISPKTVEKCKSIFSQKSVDDETPKLLPKWQSKSTVSSKFENGSPLNVNEPSKGIMNENNALEDAKIGISFVSVANKRALFEKSKQDDAISKTIPLKCTETEQVFANKPQLSNGKFNTMNSNGHFKSYPLKPNVTTVTLNRNICDRSKENQPNKDRVDHFKRSIHTIDETSTTNSSGKYETKHIEQKTVVSFSKDLLNAPNNYPDQIRVKKTTFTNQTRAIPDNPFHNIRFSIKTDCQVIPKPK